MSITWRGVELDQSTVDKLKLAEAWLEFQLEFPQGSYSTAVAASGGTHSGGGAVDVHCNDYPRAKAVNVVHWLRAVGFAAWHRPPNWDGAGGSEHVHAIEIGNPNLADAAADQVTQWNLEENGLAGHDADTGELDKLAGRPALVTTFPTPAADGRRRDEEVQ